MPRHERSAPVGVMFLFLAALWTAPAVAAPYAAMVMDARSGEVLHARNADSRLHPASLTKMMTLYIAFQAVEHGEISLDTVVTISRHAASEPPSKLGLWAGQKIKLRYLVRAAAVKSANDAATAIGEAISGSEAAFARRMNRTAASLGMSRTTFKNAHGLTESGHLSTARDMTVLGRHLFYDYPEYYNLFSRITTHAGVREVANTNRRFLNAYSGADGIKTGYTRAAGFNLVASAERGGERIIATMFGGRSTAQRNERVAELLNMGFDRAPSRVAVRRPAKPAPSPGDDGPASHIVSAVRAPAKSPTPLPRPDAAPELPEDVLVAMAETIEETVSAVETATEAVETVTEILPSEGPAEELAEEPATVLAAAEDAPAETSPAVAPRPRPKIFFASAPPARDTEEARVVVERISTSGDRHWGINVGRYASRYQAERVLLQTALTEIGTLDEALRKVKHSPQGFDALFVGLTHEGAALACQRLKARNIDCTTLGPG